MKKIIRQFHRLFSRFQIKLLAAFLLCTLIPFGVISYVSYSVTRSIAWNKTMDASILAGDQLYVQLSARIRQAENVADALQYNMYTLVSANEQELSAYLDTITLLRNDISLYLSTFDFYQICVFLKDGQFGSNEGLYFYPLSQLEPLLSVSPKDLQTLGASSLWLYRPQIKTPFLLSADKKTDSVICCRALFNQGSGQLDYAYFILMDTAEFSSMLVNSFSNTDTFGYLAMPDGTIIAASDPELYHKQLSADFMQKLATCQSPYFFYEDSYIHVSVLDNGWYQITDIPKSYITSSTEVLLRAIMITLIIALSATVLVILLISRNLSVRIHTLAGAMETFRLNPNIPSYKPLTVPKPDDPSLYDEIDMLGLTFEQMQAAIQNNLKSILELSLKEERLKYQLLQSQINPHFLYNILGSIKTCQSLGRLDVADQMITDLTRFYRLTLHKSNELILLRDELEIAALYLNMEKLCHNNNLDWEIDLESGIENFLICRFTLQPFLENCILHGISAHTPNIKIQISAVYGDDTVIIKIRDNGAGISPEKLTELRQSLKSQSVNYEKHFGVCNVNARISSEYYGSGHIEIESIPCEGTCITIEFSQMEGEED
jgi:two-component system sensor histidine kinase YesM